MFYLVATASQGTLIILKNVLSNQGTAAQMDVVMANAGLAIHCIK